MAYNTKLCVKSKLLLKIGKPKTDLRNTGVYTAEFMKRVFSVHSLSKYPSEHNKMSERFSGNQRYLHQGSYISQNINFTQPRHY